MVTSKKNMVPKERTPDTYKPNTFIIDTVNQAYRDAMNVQISPIRVNQSGYLESDPERQFYYVGDETSFEIVDIDGKSFSPAITGTLVASGQKTSSKWHINAGTNAATGDQWRYSVTATGPSGNLMIGNIPQGVPTDTRLRIKVGKNISSTFIVSERVYSMVRDASLKFYGINRSGNSESWFHEASHTKDGGGPLVQGPIDVRSPFDASQAGTLQGGYYDCGDHLKESQTQMYAFMVTALIAATNPNADEDHYDYNHKETINKDGIPDILREAKHGADFVLRSFVRAKGVIDDMALSIGNSGTDHAWWGRPEDQDNIPVDGSTAATDRGGPGSRPVRQGEIGANVGGETAAGLAMLSKMYAEYDPKFADSCLMVAEKMYDFAKSLIQGKKTYDGGKPFVHNGLLAISSPAYQGNQSYIDDIALASVALLYATGKKEYADDMIRTRDMFDGQQFGDGPCFFQGGWFVTSDKGFFKNVTNTSWANTYSHALYALYKLILSDKDKALKEYGLTEEEWLNAIEDCIANMIANISDMSKYIGIPETLIFPTVPNIWKQSQITYDNLWFMTLTDQNWIYNRYLAGNIFDILAYADITSDIEKKGISLPIMGTPDWKAAEAKQFAINQLNYLLGVNPWDVSFIMGIGDKNDAHPHHRAANPEGKNVPGGTPYKYKPPVGGLYGAAPPLGGDLGDGVLGLPDNLSWEYYQMSEICIDATASFLSAVSLASKKIDKTIAPDISVEIRHVSVDSAIVVVKLSQRGTVDIMYSKEDNSFTEKASSASAGVFHQIVLKNLTPGTLYNFYVKGYNAYKPTNSKDKYMVDSTKTPYSFTTLNMLEAADIQNITVCNVSADSAEIMWYTPNGEYESKVYWDVAPHNNASEYAYNTGNGNADVSGIPTNFHYVKIGGLKEKTTYYYMVESNGKQVNTNSETNTPLKFTTPVTQYNFSVKTLQYEWDKKPAININIVNNESRAFDSLTIRMYMRGDDDLYDDVAIRTDICQAYDEAGFNKACDASTLAVLNEGFRHVRPVKIEDTYDAESKTWQWYYPIPLGSTVIKSSSRFRIDVLFVARIRAPGQDDPLDTPPQNKRLYCRSGNTWHWVTNTQTIETIDKNPGDWSWMPHSTDNAEDIDYPGMPCEDKNVGDVDFEAAPVNPYVSVYRKDEFVWGFSPSKSEMNSKRADYKLDITLDPPFNVSNGSYIELDQTSSTVYVTGHAHITEGGYITKIWANGQLVTGTSTIFGNEKLVFDDKGTSVVAQYNLATGLWDLKIPVKMGVGSNKVDITVFAGPDPSCEECQENGGCAFENRNYYVHFTRGNLTPSALTIKDKDGNPIVSPATPGSTQFNIFVRDLDKAKYTEPLTVLVINSKKSDTLVVELQPDPSTPGNFYSANLISAVSKPKESRGKDEISFFPGDTIQVIYIDPDDEEDISKQMFFAESHDPAPQTVLAQDTDCDGVTDQLSIKFSNAFNEDYSLDSIRLFLDGMPDTVNVALDNIDYLEHDEVILPLTGIGVPVTPSPSGKATIVISNNGTATHQSIKVTDGIPPTLMSVTLLENPNHESEQDTLMVAFSEPVILTDETTFPIATDGAPGTITLVTKPTTANDGLSWLYVVVGNTEGKVIPVKGKATIAQNALITDKALNRLIPGGGCNPSVTIVETPKPVPVTLAEMRDHEGDGYPDELYIRFQKHLRPIDMLDSFVVDWGRPSIIKSFITKFDSSKGSIKPTDDFWTIKDSTTSTGTISIVNIHIPSSMSYPLGTTSGANGNESGYYGSITPRLGPKGGFFDKDYPVVDACPPIILRARKEMKKNMSILTVTYSEPLTDLNVETLHYIERKRGSKADVYPAPQNVTPGDSKATFFYNESSDDGVNVGDFIRFDINAATSRYKDKAGNYPTRYNPWVKVIGDASEKTRFSVAMVQPVAQTKKGIPLYTPETQPAHNDIFRLTVLNADNTESIVNLNNNTIGMRLGAEYVHGGPLFLIKVFVPAAQTGGNKQKYLYDIKLSVDAHIYDNIGQYIAQKKFNIDFGENPAWREAIAEDGTLYLNLEWLVHNEAAPRSEKGKFLGTGAYIAKFDFNATQTCTEDTEGDGEIQCKIGSKEKTSDEATKTFGFKRVK